MHRSCLDQSNLRQALPWQGDSLSRTPWDADPNLGASIAGGHLASPTLSKGVSDTPLPRPGQRKGRGSLRMRLSARYSSILLRILPPGQCPGTCCVPKPGGKCPMNTLKPHEAPTLAGQAGGVSESQGSGRSWGTAGGLGWGWDEVLGSCLPTHAVGKEFREDQRPLVPSRVLTPSTGDGDRSLSQL